MKCILTFFLMIIHFSVFSQQQRALLIGIDRYAPATPVPINNSSGRTQWHNLEGCVNDAMAIKNEIILRWGFKNENIQELYDSNATRINILAGIENLLANSKSGDIAFIFYAGHGSQVKNSKSKEPDKSDESLVPADGWKQGVEDIRDKTLADLINKFINNGVMLTTIYDCCHSGSMGKGLANELPKFRYMKSSNDDVMDDSNPPIPELRTGGRYLSIAASQENEPAQEQLDDNNMPHGAFTIALIKAMNQQSVDASVGNLFTATRAILKSNGKNQEPVMGGSSLRLHGTLFGMNTGVLKDKILIPLMSIKDTTLVFQGGLMAGLNVGNELKKTGTDIHVKITAMQGANRCMGTLLSGKPADIHAGELFEVTNWVSNAAPFLNLYVPPGLSSLNQLEDIRMICMKVKKSIANRWIDDLEKHDANVSFYYRNGQWFANDSSSSSLQLPEFSEKAIIRTVRERSVYINIPPPGTLFNALKILFSDHRNVRLTANANEAQYFLSGTINDYNQLSYGWVRCQAAAADSLETLPLQTKSFGLAAAASDLNSITDSLYSSCVRLAKIRAWLNLQAPRTTGQFPFKLQVRNKATGKPLEQQGIALGDKLSVNLEATENFQFKWDRKKRFIYVFVIDRSGNMSLIYPDENSGNVNNSYPVLDDGGQPMAQNKLAEGVVTEPVGTDTYFLLATEDPIPDYFYAFNQEGVKGVANQVRDNPLNTLINWGNPATRGPQKPVNVNWSLERVLVKTHH